MLDKKFFNELAKDVRDKYRKLVFDPAGGGKSAKDVHGKPYKQYSTGYGTAKRAGGLKGIDKTPQHKKHKDSRSPVLTGLLMNSFDSIGSHTQGFGFGSTSQKGLIKKLSNMGRDVTTNAKPVPNEVAEFIMDEMTKDVKGAFKKIRKKIKRKKININIKK